MLLSKPTFKDKGQPKTKKCEHGRQKSQCKDCGGVSICMHSRLKSRCKECGGACICVHGRLRSGCKDCGGVSICEHGRRRWQCKDCGGSCFCMHGRLKSRCKDCGGACICVHSRVRSQCKDCRGASICEHQHHRSRCKDCGGSSICKHGRIKSTCKECGGSRICEHDRQKSQCKDCGGASICMHSRQRSQCKDCIGASICVHNRIRSKCKDCRGASICEHGKQRSQCKDCGYKCNNCNLKVVRKKGSLCNDCLPVAKQHSRFKEARIKAELDEWASDGIILKYTSWNKTIQFTNPKICGSKRPDFAWDLGHYAVLLEVDESQHKHYELRCELIRMSIIVESYGGIPVHIIRYNSDAFKINGKTRRTSYAERVTLLKTELSNALKTPDFENLLIIQYLWYDQDDKEFSSIKRFKTLEDYHSWVEEKAPLS